MALHEKHFTASQAAKQLDTTPSTLRRWVNRGLIRAGRTPGGRLRVPESEIAAARDRMSAATHEDKSPEGGA